MKLALIRHGKTEANDLRIYCGATDLPLSEKGEKELLRLRDEAEYPDPSAFRLYTSGMRRTEQTLSILFGERPHDRLPEMREMDFGTFEMRGYEQLRGDPDYIRWCEGDNESNPTPGGESGRDLAGRVLACLERLKEDGEDAIVVTHGGPIAIAMACWFPREEKNRYQWQPENGAGYLVEWTSEGCSYTRLPKRRKEVQKEDMSWKGKGYSFFQNKACEYFPCHDVSDPEQFSCLFCYCPLYALGDRCGGSFRYTEKGFKDCSRCVFPHLRDNYGRVIARYPEIQKLACRRDLPPDGILDEKEP